MDVLTTSKSVLVDEEATFSQTRPATVARPPPPESGDASECSPVELVDQ